MNSVDQRIVEMRFDNKQFENGVQTSIKSLDNLKSGLKLDESAKSLSNLEKVGNSFSLAGIADGVDNLNHKFSTLGLMGITVLQNITNSAIDTGKRLISSLTVDPIKTGLEEYETKMNAITTILTNTKSKGTTLDDVNKSLNELNTYADKTIYNFAEMTRNIGTFTAAGVDLKTATTSIKGIANLAAGSGSNAQQASTAMYQLSQAISTGTVKLMDWNSVVNAGMGGELFQKALEKTAKELGHGRDMSISFRDSLESGWLTAEVLTKTLSKFAEDEDLLKAATQVKTFTQLLDTMKESVQSGWAQSWETIIGNKDEAAKFFTSLNDGFNSIVGTSSNARNLMLTFWKDNGGRDALIKSLSNAFDGLGFALKQIHDAFIEVFPPMTGEKLLSLTKGLEVLTGKIRINDDTAYNLYRTFKGLFAILDIGKQGFIAIGNGISKFINYISPASSGILSLTATIGDYIVGLDTAIKSSNAFNNAINKIAGFMKPIADGVKKSISLIIDAFKEFANVDLTGLNTFTERVQARFEPFTKLGNFLEDVFLKMADVIKRISPVFYSLASIIGRAFDKMRDNIIKAFDNAEFNSVFDIINGGLFAGILLGLKKFISSVTKITDSTGGFLKGITGILNGVKGCLQAYQNDIKANTLIKIAAAMGILSASLLVLSMIDSQKLTSALTAMSVMFVELFGSMGVFEKVMGSAGFKGLGKITISMIAVSTAILILSNAMTKLAQLDWSGITKGLVSVAYLMSMLVGAAKILSMDSGGMIKGATGFVIFSAAIVVLTNAVTKLGQLDTASLIKGLIGVGVLITELALFMKVTDLDGMGILKGAGILLLATAMTILAEAVSKFGSLDTASLIKGLIGVATILGEIALFVNMTGDSKRVISTATGLTILGAAMLIFAEAIIKMGGMSWEQIGKGLLTMAMALAEVVVALKFIPKDIALTGTGLVIVASALVILSKALSNMGNMSWEQIAKGLVTLAGSLTVIAIAMAFMKTALPGAAALLVVSAALSILTPVLATLGSMSLSEIGKGLLALAGVFVVIGAAGLLLSPLIPAILGLSAAIALFGAGCLAVGVGMLAFSTGLTALAAAGTVGTAALVATVTAIVGLIPFALTTLAQGIVDFVKVIGDGAPIIAAAATAVVLSIINAISAITPTLIEAIYKILSSLMDTMVKYAPKMVDAGMKLIISFLKGVSNNIKEVTETAINIIVNFIDGIASKTGDIIQSGFNLMLAFINGLADSIRNNTDKMIDAVENLMAAVIESGLKILMASLFGFIDVGSKLMDDGFIKGVSDKIGNFIFAVEDFVDGGIGAIKKKFDDFYDIGKYIIDGFINGVRSKITDAANWTENLAKTTVESAKRVLGIHSPSKVFQDEVGAMIGAGMANGIEDSTKDATDAAAKMSKGVYETAKEWIDTRKYYNQLSLDEELYVWQEVQKKYNQGTQERIDTDKEIYRVQKEIRQQEYNDSINWIDDRKYYNKLSLQDELAAWERVQARYEEGTEERIKAEKELYRVRQELSKASYQDSIDWIDEQKYYNQLTLSEELAAWERVQKRYEEGTEERKKADREVYRVKQEITDKLKSLEDDYYDKTKSVNDKMVADIKKLNDEYDNAVTSRTNSLYSTYGLFDDVSSSESVSGSQLLSNLENQVDAFNNWQENIDALSAKGVSDDFIKELRDMGPKSSAQIKALNTLSSQDLNDYVALWREKHNQAKTQAISELEDLRSETDAKISQITIQSQNDLDALRNTWYNEMEKINGTTKKQLTTLNNSWNEQIGNIKDNCTQTLSELATDINSMDWNGVGSNIVNGISEGANSQMPTLVETITAIATTALDVIKAVLGIHSPSKEFSKIGMYADEGLANGLKQFSGIVTSASADVGNAASSSLGSALSNIVDGINSDINLSPTIRPVIDLSNVKDGVDNINGLFAIRRGIDVSSINNRVSTIANGLSNGSSTEYQNGSVDKINSTLNKIADGLDNQTPIHIDQLVVREESDINKIARELYNIQRRNGRPKEVSVW